MRRGARALTGLIDVFTMNQLLCSFDALALLILLFIGLNNCITFVLARKG